LSVGAVQAVISTGRQLDRTALGFIGFRRGQLISNLTNAIEHCGTNGEFDDLQEQLGAA
jgi:hypothetical protein